ncbi:MAG: carboxypeptidase-like regulatory domain-containing protein, partial [Pseudomonadota bacterium]
MSKRLSFGAAVLLGTSTLAATALMPTLAMAQVTTSSIRGFVETDAGAPVPNATVTIVNSETGFSRVVTTDGSGSFSVRNLSLTGAYDVTVRAPNLQAEIVEDVVLSLGDDRQLNFNLSSTDITDEIIVVAQR